MQVLRHKWALFGNKLVKTLWHTGCTASLNAVSGRIQHFRLTIAVESKRDIVVIGGSAGAIDVVGQILERLPDDLPAAVFVVIHVGPESPGFLVDILSRRSRLPVHFAMDHEPIELGKVYVATAGHHLLVKPGEVRVIFGPKENNFRPAIDPLFRSAANIYDGRVVGVLLSGALDDGTHGILQIHRAGGMTVVQSPDDAEHRAMPESAIRRVKIDFVRPASEIGPLIADLVSRDVDVSPTLGDDEVDVSEGLISALRLPNVRKPSPFICPDCNGALWEVNDGDVTNFRCHVGHGFGVDTLLSLQATKIEQALWSAVRGFEERAALQKRTANGTSSSIPEMRTRLLESAREQQQMADLLRSILVRSPKPERPTIGHAIRDAYTKDRDQSGGQYRQAIE
jgi:two-component system, chemotaxis family, protein-glutamate methylesterase/glutaminase